MRIPQLEINIETEGGLVGRGRVSFDEGGHRIGQILDSINGNRSRSIGYRSGKAVCIPLIDDVGRDPQNLKRDFLVRIVEKRKAVTIDILLVSPARFTKRAGKDACLEEFKKIRLAVLRGDVIERHDSTGAAEDVMFVVWVCGGIVPVAVGGASRVGGQVETEVLLDFGDLGGG